MKDHLNLLPQKFQDATAASRRVKYWAAGLCAIIVACAAVLSHQKGRIAELRQQQATNAIRVNPLRVQLAESNSARTQLNELRTKHTLVSMLEDELPAVQILGVVSHSARDPERRILVTDVRTEEVMQDLPPAGPPPPGRRPPKPKQEKVLAVVVSGVARDDISVARFVGNLRQSKMFRSVKLNSTSGSDQASDIGRQYEVKCVY